METIKHFLTYSFDGAPVWGWALGVAFLHLEWWMGRTKKVNANGTLELIPDVLLKLGGRFVPGLSSILKTLGSTRRLEKEAAADNALPEGDITPTDPARPGVL